MTPDLEALIVALRRVCVEHGCASASASYVSPLEGRLITLHVTAGGVAYIADEEGGVLPVRIPGVVE